MANPALIDELEKQFRDNPRRVFARLANEYRKAGDFMRAIEICHAHVQQQPGYISGHVVLGQALYDAGELEQAQLTFQTALGLDPENLIALRQLGDIARDRREYGDARSWYTRLLEIDPQNDDVVAQLGELSLVEGAMTGAGSGAALNGKHETVTGAEATDAPAPDETPAEEVDAVSAWVPAEDDTSIPLEEEDNADEREPVTTAAGPSEEPASPASAPSWSASEQPAPDEESEAPATAGEVMMLDEGAVYEGEMVFSAEEPALEPLDLTPALEPDDDVAWIAAERIDVESTAFTIMDATEPTGDDAGPPSLELMDDLDFTFETEEPETTLEMHDGDSLSIISEEDPLAGVQPVRNADPSPFGVDFERPASDEPDVSFEPLPISEIDAASNEGATETGAAEPEVAASPWMDAEPSRDAGGFAASAEPAPDAFELSDAGTLVEEPNDASRNEPAATSEPDVPERQDPAHESMPWWEASTPAAPDLDEPEEQASQSAPWWEVGPPAPEPEPAAAAALPDEPPVASEPDADLPGEEGAEATFVTETMAELYLQQGFRQEALDVYRRLAEQSPNDAALRERIAHLERSDAAAESDPAAAAAGAPSRSASSFFKSLASVRPTPPSSTGSAGQEQRGWEASALSGAGEVDPADAEAATALSKGFAPQSPEPQQPRSAIRAADRDMSLHDIFGAEEPDKEGEPSGSMDAFFTPDGERAGGSETGGGDDDDDIEAFNAWLEGLKK